MILFRNCPTGLPFFLESTAQPEGRWHGVGEGPVQYLCDTPEGAWAEWLRHEEIKTAEEVAEVRRALWAVELPEEEDLSECVLSGRILAGDVAVMECQEEARRLRSKGAKGFRVASAAITTTGARFYQINDGAQVRNTAESRVYVLFGRRPDIAARCLVWAGCPRPDLLTSVRPLNQTNIVGEISTGPPRVPADEQELLSQLWHTIFSVLLIKDEHSRLKHCNDTFVSFINKNEDEIIGLSPSQYWGGDNGWVVEQYDAVMREAGMPVLSRERFDNRTRITARFPLKGQSNLYGSVGVWFHHIHKLITWRVQRQGFMRPRTPSGEILRAFFDSCPWAISILDFQTEKYKYVNPAFGRVFTRPGDGLVQPREVIGQSPRDLCTLDYWRKHEKGLIRSRPIPNAPPSELTVPHPTRPGASRRVVSFTIDVLGSYYTVTLGVDSHHLLQLAQQKPQDALFVAPIVLREDD